MSKSEQLFARASQSIAGGVNSPVRAFRAVGGTPVFFSKAEGPFLFDADGKRYIDYIGSWGPMIAGSREPKSATSRPRCYRKWFVIWCTNSDRNGHGGTGKNLFSIHGKTPLLLKRDRSHHECDSSGTRIHRP